MIYKNFLVPLDMARKIIKKKLIKSKINFPKKYLLFFLAIIVFIGISYLGFRLFFVASVNGRLISRYSVIKELEKQGGKRTVDILILENLINQEAKKKKITISDKELKEELFKIEKNVSSQGATLDLLLEQQKMTKKDFEKQIILKLLVEKMIDNKVSITDKEVDEYLSYYPDLTREQVKESISQQKLQDKIEAFLSDLKSKAKINYFIRY